MELRIWWLSQAEHESLDLEVDVAGLRPYIRSELSSMDGRPLRGRLWAGLLPGAESPSVLVARFTETALGRWLGSCGGIVVRAEDVGSLAQMPGTVTDFELRRERA